jgi:DNA-binding winged helix-turn-helix (wHTH) protein
MSTSVSSRILQFGPFEAEVQAGELRKQGLKVRLQDQPFQILVMLLDRHGELVTRQEIHQKLWPADTFVDFDHGLNNAVNRLREALGDSAEFPRFIETLPKKGYRFIGKVTGDEPQPSSAVLH